MNRNITLTRISLDCRSRSVRNCRLCVFFLLRMSEAFSRLEFLEDGTLILNVDHEESDYLFDEIGSELKIREIQREKVELMTALERYFRIVFLGEDAEEVLTAEREEEE